MLRYCKRNFNLLYVLNYTFFSYLQINFISNSGVILYFHHFSNGIALRRKELRPPYWTISFKIPCNVIQALVKQIALEKISVWNKSVIIKKQYFYIKSQTGKAFSVPSQFISFISSYFYICQYTHNRFSS